VRCQAHDLDRRFRIRKIAMRFKTDANPFGGLLTDSPEASRDVVASRGVVATGLHLIGKDAYERSPEPGGNFRMFYCQLDLLTPLISVGRMEVA
jgi:hypothetical protein